MDKIDEIVQQRELAHARLLELGSRVYGALPKKVKELIAVGISVVTDRESCMQWHIEQAASAGATEAELLEAVEVGMEMGGGPATVSARFAVEVMERAFPA